MNAIIPEKRRDGQSSFVDLVSYVSVRDEPGEDDDLISSVRRSAADDNAPHRNRFSRLVDYATKLRDESFVSLVDVMPDGGEWVNFYGVTCFHNCTSIETAAEEMEFVAGKAKFAHTNSDPVFHYIMSWQAHESPRPEQIYDSVRHSLSRLGLSDHQFVSAVHTDTDNLHVHVAVNRVHPDTGYLNRLSYSQEKLSKSCRELELKHGFAPDNGCYVIGPGNRIVRRTSLERDRLNAWQRGRKQTLKEFIADTAIAGLREEPVSDWSSLHLRFAQHGLFLMSEGGQITVKDGWESTRPGVSIMSFGRSWSTEKLTHKLGEFEPPAKDIFRQVSNVGRFDPDRIVIPSRPETVSENQRLVDYASLHLRAPLAKLDQERALHNVVDVHRSLAEHGLYLQEQHGRLVLCDGFERNRTPVRAEHVWPGLTVKNLSGYEGGWKAVPADIFRQVRPKERFTGGELKSKPVGDKEWLKMRMGAGPQGAIKREIFADKESLWGYAVSHCRRELETLIERGDFSWQRCHETFARQGLLLAQQHQGLVVVDAYNRDQTPVKASSVHPDLTLARAVPQAGPYEGVPKNIFEHVRPESRYNPELAVSDRNMSALKRDPDLRRERRESRAHAREDLKARYAAWRENWQRPDLHAKERRQEIFAECRMRKEHIRVRQHDPLLRKLQYHIVEIQRMQALLHLKDEMKVERQQLVADGKWYPPSYRQWVEVEALKGDKAAISQLRGWDYRDRRKDGIKTTTPERCVVICEPGGSPVYRNVPGMKAALQKTGCVHFRDEQTGRHVCTDYGDRVTFRNHDNLDLLRQDMSKVAPVLFSRDPRFGFAPQGNNAQFNQAFADMVAWHNVNGTAAGREYQISRPEVDGMRLQSEEYYREQHVKDASGQDKQQVQSADWRPPSLG
ncbi:relaxase NikB [Salmonella enterica subsp. enterica]|nr:relaxase/mobilization nuclease domain-containing protein [Salmonella enterica subsp. enterica]MIF52506.1 relaxase NikB [Salmonella enterica subsp. enterica]